MRIGGKPVSEVKVPPDARWVVEGDRGVTYSAMRPAGAEVVEGQWWAPDYRGPQLVSYDAALAHSFGLGIGDTITVNVLGRDIEARIASLRRIEWQTLAINFVFVFSPGTLDKAPHTFLAVKRRPKRGMIFSDHRSLPTSRWWIRDAIETASDVPPISASPPG